MTDEEKTYLLLKYGSMDVFYACSARGVIKEPDVIEQKVWVEFMESLSDVTGL